MKNRGYHTVLVAAVVTGAVVGLIVAGFERVANDIFLEHVLEAPLWQQVLAPMAGLILTALLLRFAAGGATPSTADEYVANFHEKRTYLSLRPLAGRLAAGATTVGFGGAMGLEGPSIYAGAAFGSFLQRRARRFFLGEDAKLLLVAGAAAGVAAVFKAPATGVIFALEVPYRDDVARRALIPALLASATSYLVFVTLVGSTEPLFPLFGSVPRFELPELGGAVAVGLLAGVCARYFSIAVQWAKGLQRHPTWKRVLVAGPVIAGVIVIAHYWLGRADLGLGPGYGILQWIADPNLSSAFIIGLFALRTTATLAAMGGGGAGGLFIPLAVSGLLLGRLIAGVLNQPSSSLFPFIGLAAFLGAGYRTPLTSVMFVAESTGRANFVVPALLAAAVSQLPMGRWSVSAKQQSVRSGHLERRFQLPISAALTTDVLTVPPDATMAEFVYVHVLGNRERSVPVVDDGRFVGMCDLDLVNDVPREHWDTTTIEPIVRLDLSTARSSWTLRDAMAAMEDEETDRIAVTDDHGNFVGLVLLAEILKLDEILDETNG